ncbi:MAG: hypothetical protein OEQ13_00420 [Acidobacteriota bacterium]|nr:hypothetical protein [Acidobacteriota bacterium]
MSPKTYCMVSGAVFFIVAAAHLVRALLSLPFEIGNLELAPWVSWVGAVTAGALSAWGFHSAGR